MTDSTQTQEASQLNQAVADGGAYELIRRRLIEQGQTLESKLNLLNQQREAEFGKTQLEVLGRIRVRTANNCTPRDIVRINNTLLFGYNVFIGLKKETKVEDVFSLYELHTNDDIDVNPIPNAQSFLAEPKFTIDFNELYAYYKHTRLQHLQIHNQKLLATFQIGNSLTDIRVFRWSISNEGKVNYIDNRGERDLLVLPFHDFEWQATGRDDQVIGSYPHLSIMDKLFVDTINGRLTIKVENNTEDGFGIYQEKVEEEYQSLDDAEIFYAAVGALILLKIRPYREEQWRYLVFNIRTQSVERIDAIGLACIQLPEDHGIIFPGGCYLQNGELKIFTEKIEGLVFKNKVLSPNGEDVLYVFHEPEEGLFALFSYNLIRKELQNPIYAHGYCLFDDGKAVIFRAESAEATRNHPMQLWVTPFFSDEHAQSQPASKSFLGKIGNAELVRAVSDLFSIKRAISVQKPNMALYEDIISACQRVFDGYYWLDSQEVGDFASTVKSISITAELVLDEFEKVESIQAQANNALNEAKIEQQRLLKNLQSQQWQTPQKFIEGLTLLRKQLGHLQTIREFRYMNLAAVDALAVKIRDEQESLGNKTIRFLSGKSALDPYHQEIQSLEQKTQKLNTVADLNPLLATLEEMSAGLDLLNGTLSSIKIEDSTIRTSILESISVVYAKLNQAKARSKLKSKELGAGEAVAEFSAQFTLLSQSITSAMSLADTPDKCDEQLSRLSVQLEELEGRFSEHDEFLADILTKREELYEAFETKKQSLIDEQQRRAQNLINAAQRIFTGIDRRSQTFSKQDDLNTYFSSDAMVMKIAELSKQLRRLKDNVRADDLESRLKAIKEQAIRALRDKTDIFEQGGNVIKLGKHRFSVNTQGLDLTLVKRGDELAVHLTGTDFVEIIRDSQLNQLTQYWEQSLISETAKVYRGEYLAAQIIESAEGVGGEFNFEQLLQASLDEESLDKLIRTFSGSRYQEGYEKGVHDTDCGKILRKLLPLREQAGLLRYTPLVRALAIVFWAGHKDDSLLSSWCDRARSAKKLADTFAINEAFEQISAEIHIILNEWFEAKLFPEQDQSILVCQYLARELAADSLLFVSSAYADQLAKGLMAHLEKVGHKQHYLSTVGSLQNQPYALWALTESWLKGYIKFTQQRQLQRFIPEAIALLIAKGITLRVSTVELMIEIDDLLGDHTRIVSRTMKLSLDEFEERLNYHNRVVSRGFKAFQSARQNFLAAQKQQLSLESFQAKPLASFVRNKLINEVYLPIIGDNLAKQMGTVGDSKRSDLMGMLLLISPPGYGKTTLMEYMADRLGLIFVKVNCPALGHQVHSLDPANAPNATAKQELEKLNLAFEMGNNVMLYLDDIQHTHAEFLQKFISLCDGTRRIEGVWKAVPKTYDLRGKKFCVVMAGNPYTESGDMFKIPDMLANRADVYNLGDVLGGKERVFSSSYIENSLTSNSVLAPLAVRDMNDVYKFMSMAGGEDIASTELSHAYSSAEISEITSVLKKLHSVQRVILKVNQQYIASAATADKYREEPAFKLQGSYRNMNKMAEKVVAIMDDNELQEMINDHYMGEAQLLTSGAEENLLKLAELRGIQSEAQKLRWQQIKKDYLRIKATGGDDADAGTKVANQIAYLGEQLAAMQNSLGKQNALNKPIEHMSQQFSQMRKTLEQSTLDIKVINQPLPGIEVAFKTLADTIDTTFMPVVKAMNHKIDLDLNILHKVGELSQQLRAFTNTSPSNAKASYKISNSSERENSPERKNSPVQTNKPKRKK